MTTAEIKAIWERLLERYKRYIMCQPAGTDVKLLLEGTFDQPMLQEWITANRLEVVSLRINRTTNNLMVLVRR